MIKKSKVKLKERKGFQFLSSDFSKKNFIEGGVIRPLVFMIAYLSFILAMFMLLLGNLKWGGSLILFSFVVNLFSIYESLCDEPSVFKKMNLGFKFVMFFLEILVFNEVLIIVL